MPICQPVLRTAHRQLLSLFVSSERGLFRCSRVSQPVTYASTRPKDESVPVRRCFVSVPPPPSTVTVGQCDDAADVLDNQGQEQGDVNAQASNQNARHIPVMVEEVVSLLEPKNNQVLVDMTFGAGGHARHILETSPGIRYIGADRDPTAVGLAKQFATKYREGQVVPVLSKFSELPARLEDIGAQPGSVDAFLLDLGVSSMQFDSANRGFALSQDGPLDMRMDSGRFPDSPTAADVVNTLEPHQLAHILKKYGEERHARAIAHAIVEARYAFGRYSRTRQLADVVKAVFDSNFRHDKLHRHAHVATKTFQALRIFVNDELNELYNGLEVAHRYLRPGGRCVVISFHSLEDRIVKRHFHGIAIDLQTNVSLHDHLRNGRVSHHNQHIKDKYLSRQWLPLRKKLFEPSASEVARNPRSRSAKLRAAVKTASE